MNHNKIELTEFEAWKIIWREILHILKIKSKENPIFKSIYQEERKKFIKDLDRFTQEQEQS